MTEFNYHASGTYNPRGMFGHWDVSATFVDGPQTYTIASHVKSPVYLDSGLINYLQHKHQAHSVFSKGQTFETPFSVVGSDCSPIIATPTIGYNVNHCTYTVTDGLWNKSGGYFNTLVKELLKEKYNLDLEDFVCHFGTFQIKTWLYQPRSVSSVPPVTTTPTTTTTTTTTTTNTVPIESTIDADPFGGGGIDIFGGGDQGGDY